MAALPTLLGPPLQRLASSFSEWSRDPLRKASNEVGGALDGRIWGITLAGGLLYLVFKHVLEEHLYGKFDRVWEWLAGDGFATLIFCVHVLPIAGLEFWVRRRHLAAYLKHRELLVTLGIFSTLFWAPVMVLHLSNHFAPHQGSALLLAMFILNSGTLWLALFAGHARLPMRWGRVAIPLMALQPLRHQGALSHKVMEAPGVAEPLSTLCNALSLVHGVAVPIGGPDCSHFTPLQQCRTFYLWSLAFGGVALPLLATARFEVWLRRRMEQASMQRVQQAQQDSTRTLQTALQVYLCSMAAWLAACFVEGLLRPALGWA